MENTPYRNDGLKTLNSTSKTNTGSNSKTCKNQTSVYSTYDYNLPKIKKKFRKPRLQNFEQLDMNNSFLLKKIGNTKYQFSRMQYSDL